MSISKRKRLSARIAAKYIPPTKDINTAKASCQVALKITFNALAELSLHLSQMSKITFIDNTGKNTAAPKASAWRITRPRPVRITTAAIADKTPQISSCLELESSTNCAK